MRTLPAKARFENQIVARTWETITERVSRAELQTAIDLAVFEALVVLSPYSLAEVGWGYSGGKDSIALLPIIERLGILRGVCGIVPRFEFPCIRPWLLDTLPEGVDLLENDGLDEPWLARHPEKLFPRTYRNTYFWTMSSARWAQTRWAKERGARVMIYGRRTADNNICGDASGLMPAKYGTLAYNPIRSWSHEMVLAACRYCWVDAGRSMNPIYDLPGGWVSGNGRWPGRHYGSVEEGFRATHLIDPTILPEAANRGLVSAAEWLRTNDYA